MFENSTASGTAALRRETRRRKILENSANRLRLIEGINSSYSKTPPETYEDLKQPKPEYKITEPNPYKDIINSPYPKVQISSELNDLIKSNKELKEISDILLQRDRENKEVEQEEEEKEEEIITEIVTKKEHWIINLILTKRIHYILLAIVVNILFYFNVGYLFYENIFCPFYTVKAIELISRRGAKENFHPVVFLFSAVLPQKVQKIIQIIWPIMSVLLSDLLLYLFIFIIGTKVINLEI